MTTAGKQELLARLAKLDLPDPWTQFFLFQAYGESRWHTTAHNGTPGERAASKKSYDRNFAELAQCGHPERDYVQGSGGWGGLLYPVAAMQFVRHRCVAPATLVHDPDYSLAAMVGFASGLQGWQGWRKTPTFLTTRIGWGWPAKMSRDDDYAKARAVKYAATLAKLGMPRALLDARMPILGLSADDAYERLTAP